VNNPQGHNQHTNNEDNSYAHNYYPQDDQGRFVTNDDHNVYAHKHYGHKANKTIDDIDNRYAHTDYQYEETVAQRERDEQGRFVPNSYAHNDLDVRPTRVWMIRIVSTVPDGTVVRPTWVWKVIF